MADVNMQDSEEKRDDRHINPFPNRAERRKFAKRRGFFKDEEGRQILKEASAELPKRNVQTIRKHQKRGS